MARVWSCGFELQTVTSGVEWDTTVGSPTISTTVARSGAASLRCNVSGTTAYIQHQCSTSERAPWYVRAYYRWSSFPTTGSAIIMQALDSANLPIASIRVTSTGVLQLWDDGASSQSGSDSEQLQLDTWYRVELEIKPFGSGGSAYLVNGTPFATDASFSNGENLDRFRFGAVSSTTMDMYVDDIAVNDNAGAVQNGLPGEGRIIHLHPAGAGASNDWTAGAGGSTGAENNWTRVSEATPDDATSYNEHATTGTAVDDFTVGAAGLAETESVTLIQVGARLGSDGTTGTRDLALRLTAPDNTTTTGSTVTCSVNGWATHTSAAVRLYSLTSYANPSTSDPWTVEDLDDIQIGYTTVTSASVARRVSTLWALVEYTEGDTPPPPTWLRQNTCDGPDGVAVTVANSGGALGNAWSGTDAGIVYTSDAYLGGGALRFASGLASGTGVVWSGLTLSDFAVRGYLKRDAAASGGNIAWADSVGAMQLTTGGGLTWAGLALPAGSIPAETWVRIEVRRDGATGYLSVWSTDPNSTGAPDATDSDTITTGTVGQWWWERYGTGGIVWDELVVDDGAVPIGPAVPPEPPPPPSTDAHLGWGLPAFLPPVAPEPEP